MIVIGQILPRAIARRWPAGVAPVAAARAAAAIELIRRRWPRSVEPSRGVAVEPRPPSRRTSSRDAIQDLLREGELEGVGEREEIEIISGVVDVRREDGRAT